MKQFRPESISKRYIMRARRRGAHPAEISFNFRDFSQYEHRGPLNEQTIIRMFRRVHYLTSHAPQAVRLQNAAMRLHWNRKMDRKASVAYTNKYSLHKFL